MYGEGAYLRVCTVYGLASIPSSAVQPRKFRGTGIGRKGSIETLYAAILSTKAVFDAQAPWRTASKTAFVQKKYRQLWKLAALHNI